MDVTSLHPELKFRTSRSSGSGGQHVNKVETRVELLFDVNASAILSDPQKELIKDRLGNRINKEGILTISRQGSRSQHQNKEAAILLFDELIAQALRPQKKRKKVRPSKASRELRLQNKKQQSEKKALRKKIRY